MKFIKNIFFIILLIMITIPCFGKENNESEYINEIKKLREAIEDKNQLESAGYQDWAQAIMQVAKDLDVDDAIELWNKNSELIPEALKKIEHNSEATERNKNDLIIQRKYEEETRDRLRIQEGNSITLITNQETLKRSFESAQNTSKYILITGIFTLFSAIGVLIMRIVDMLRRRDSDK